MEPRSGRPPTSHDVARHAGVSQPTVSRALRDDPAVAAATRRAVLAAAEELGYIPSHRGRSLSTQATDQVAVVVSDLANPFYLQVLDRAHVTLRRHGRRMLVLTPDADEDAGLLPALLDGALDGALLTTTRLDSPLPAALAARGFPCALLNRTVADPPCDTCTVDNTAGGALAADTLVRLGHREIAAILGPGDTSTGRDRADGFRTALEGHGIAPAAERVRRGPFDFGFGRAAALELLDGRPTALFCANDVLALGALDALRARGVRVPEEVTVIGFDDIAMAYWTSFALTTIGHDIDGMVERGTEMLLDRIAEDPADRIPPRRVVLAPALVERATHAPPP
jgi:LacI family transcriptional regulator